MGSLPGTQDTGIASGNDSDERQKRYRSSISIYDGYEAASWPD